METIGVVGGLWRYPVKSLAGEALDTVRVDETGFVGDRRWALRSELDGELINAKALPSLLKMGAFYTTEPPPGTAVADAVIQLPDGRTLATGDPLVSAAMSAVAGRPLTLCPLLPESHTEHYRLRQGWSPALTLQRMGLKPDDPFPDFSDYDPGMIGELGCFFSPRGSYKDAYPIHFLTSAALNTARRYMPGADVQARRFRPNLVLDTVGDDGLPELDWKGFDLVIGDVVLNCGDKTVRCLMPSQPQLGGVEADPQMYSMLMGLAGYNFGAYCLVRNGGEIHVGDTVFLDKRKTLHPVKRRWLPLPEDVAHPETAKRAPLPPLPTAFAPAKVVGKKHETADTVTLDLKMKQGPAFRFLPGQHLTFRVHPLDGKRRVVRNFSISSVPHGATGGDADYSVTVKRIGVGSGFVCDTLEVGDEIEVRYPNGTFFDVPSSKAPLVLASNGIGVTPVFSMLKAVARFNPEREVFWLHATRNSRSHVFRDEVRALAQKLPHFHRLLIYRHPEPGDRAGEDYDTSSRIKREHFDRVGRMAGAQIFICGSRQFIDVAVTLVEPVAADAGHIHTELFNRTLAAAGSDGEHETHTVRFDRSGVVTEWSSGGQTLLEMAEDQGIEAEYGCRYGTCRACSVRLIEGTVRYPGQDANPVPGEVLLCCACPTSDVVIER